MISGFALDNDNDDGIDPLTSFEILSPFEKFKKYVDSSNVFERQAAGRTVCEAIDSCDTREEFRSTMHSVSRLSEDPEPTVRVEVMEKIPELSHKCIKKSEQLQLSSSLVEEEILPLVLHFLEDVTNTARKAGQTTLVAILPLFKPDVCQITILPIMLGLANAHTDDYRTEAVTLLAKIVPRLGRDITTELVLPVYLTSCGDDLFHIRKVCAQHAPDFARVVGLETTENQILPVFSILAEDVVWGVRKACADSFSQLSETVSEHSRRTIMSELFVSLLNDDSRWVRLSAYQELGKFISSFQKGSGSDKIMEEIVHIPKEPEVPEFTSSFFWKESLPEINFDDLSLDDLPADICSPTKIVVQEDTNRELKETIPKGSGDASLEKDEQNTIDIDLYKALDINIKGEDVIFGDEDEVPVDYSKERIKDNYAPENIDHDKTDIRLSGSQDINQNGTDLSDDQCSDLSGDSEEDDPQEMEPVNLSTHSSFLSGQSEKSMEMSQEPAEVLPQNVIPEVLLKYYVSMPSPKGQTEFHNNELPGYCAYSLPGVALTLGRQNWKCLKEIYGILSQNVQWKVRRTLAASIHEIAHILGEQMASEELVGIFNEFLNDLDEVRIGVLKNISEFLSMVNAEARINYLNKMIDFTTTDNVRNWRFRLTLAFQMNKVISLYTPQQVGTHHTQIVMDLLQDKISAVRLQAAHLAASITEHLMKDTGAASDLSDDFVKKLITFSRRDGNGRGDKWMNRCVFCYYCNALIDPISLQHPADEEDDLYDEESFNSPRRREPYVSDEYFESKLLPYLLKMTDDNITNVRICASRTVRNILVSRPYYQDKQSQSYTTLEKTMRRLADDTDKVVQHIAEEWLFDEDEDNFIALCPEDVEASLPNGRLDFSSKRVSSPIELEDIESREDGGE